MDLFCLSVGSFSRSCYCVKVLLYSTSTDQVRHLFFINTIRKYNFKMLFSVHVNRQPLCDIAWLAWFVDAVC